MVIIRNATIKFGDKKARVKLFGYEQKKKFIIEEAYINETDLVNMGIIEQPHDWNDVPQEKAE